MLEDGKISYKHIISLIVITISPTAILYLPTMNYQEAKQDGWISVLLITLFGIVVAYIITTLSLMYKNKTIIQYSEDIVGKFLGKIIGLIYCVYFIHINAVIIREFAELLSGPFMKLTPLWFFIIGIILPSIYAVIKGLEVIDRVNHIIFPIFIVAVFGIIILAYKDMDFKQLVPILADGFKPVAMGAYRHAIWFSETIIVAMIMPYINVPEKVKKMTILSILFVCLIGLAVNISIITTFGKGTEDLTYPFLSLARYISLANFIERLDSIIMFMWISGVFIKIAIFHYCAALAIAQWLKVKDYRLIAILTGILLAVLANVLWGNLVQLKTQISMILIIPYVTVQAVIPLLLLIIAKIKKGLGYG